VIAGSARGRRLKALPGRVVRPTSDRVKEALFSMIASRYPLAGAVVLDLFAGTGALGIEALSRGAQRAVFVECNARVRRLIAENLAGCGFTEVADVCSLSAERAMLRFEARHCRFDGVFVDPPYGGVLLARAMRRLGEGGVLRTGAWVVAEFEKGDALGEEYGRLRLTRARLYGRTSLALFRAAEE